MNSMFLMSLFQATVTAGASILLASLGVVFTARVGVLNLGVEGLMLVGAMTGFSIAYSTSNPWIGLLAALLVGALLGLGFAGAIISLRTNQIVTGLAMVIFGTGLSAYLGKSFIGVVSTAIFKPIWIPILSDVPFIGKLFFQYNILVYIVYLLVPVVWYFMYRTRPGLHLRAVGENPLSAETMGINPIKLRYFYIVVGCALASAGGSFLSLAYAPSWLENMTAGRGWISVAVAIFSGYNPLGALGGALLFGGVDAIGLRIQAAGISVSSFLLNMMPYILTFVVLVVVTIVKKGRGQPAALGRVYDREAH
jgi:general nucleoside transport system permease protein